MRVVRYGVPEILAILNPARTDHLLELRAAVASSLKRGGGQQIGVERSVGVVVSSSRSFLCAKIAAVIQDYDGDAMTAGFRGSMRWALPAHGFSGQLSPSDIRADAHGYNERPLQ